MARLNRAAIDLMHEIRESYETAASPMVVSGAIGPRGDGYDPGALMSPVTGEATKPRIERLGWYGLPCSFWRVTPG